ncbi:hypothetical protein [Actinoplanes subglobosus]|uniref:Uncharacterized protein n=1 Tax=Actinoplanes subglobosus TaxID=1547892 RepID=A0ABV8IRS9_9ACTN
MPFRWDLVTPAQLGTMLDGTREPNLWFLDELVECAAKVVARSGDGDLVFVGRSLDSMFDLLGGAECRTLLRLPVSFMRDRDRSGRRWRRRPLTSAETTAARTLLASVGVTPHALARRTRPVTFVDVVHEGETFTELFALLRDWIDEENETWPVIRRKLRFLGVTSRGKTSPNKYRWQQDAPWTRELPAKAVINVSLNPRVWSYFGDYQDKLTRSFRPDDWLAESDTPNRDELTRQALAEAAALVTYGRSATGRRALARAMDGEPALTTSWLRAVQSNLNRSHS